MHIEKVLDSLNIRRESRKIILKEEQERAIRVDFGECVKWDSASLHDLYGS